MEGKHSSDAITDLSLEWLSSKRDRNKPFFLMHHFKAPHDMFENAKRYDEYLEDVEIPEPDNLFTPPAGSEGSKGMGSGVGRTHAPWNLARKLGVPDLPNARDYAKAGYQTYLKRYLRCVKGVDDNIQRLIDYLKETGELDNTIIIYTSDQGVFLGEHDLMDKRWMYEESSRMPFIVYAPKRLQSGSTNDWLINNADFAPTILELAGIQKTPDYMQGRSFADALVGGAKPADWRTSLYYRYWMHLAHSLAVPAHFGLRDERYKLIFFYGCDLKGEKPHPRCLGVLRPGKRSPRNAKRIQQPGIRGDHCGHEARPQKNPRRTPGNRREVSSHPGDHRRPLAQVKHRLIGAKFLSSIRMTPCRWIDGSPQRPEIVVQADAFHFQLPPPLCSLTHSLPLVSPFGPTFGCSSSKAPGFFGCVLCARYLYALPRSLPLV
jgi:hypothetical protein